MNNKVTKIYLVIVTLFALSLIAYIVYEKKSRNIEDNNNREIINHNEDDKDILIPKETDPIEEDEETEYLVGIKEDDTITMTSNKLKSEGKLLLTKKNLLLYSIEVDNINPDVNEPDKFTLYYVINTNNNYVYSASQFSSMSRIKSDKEEYLFVILKSDEAIGMINLNKQVINTKYQDYSCYFHTDASFQTCGDNKTIVVQNRKGETTKYGLISIDTLKQVIKVDFDGLSVLSNNNVIVSKDNKIGLYNNEGKILLDVEYDYIIENDYFGYIVIKGNDMKVYDSNLKEIDLKTNDFNLLFENAYTKYVAGIKVEEGDNIDDIKNNHLIFNTEINRFTTSALVLKQDLSKKNTNLELKYTGNKFTGTKIIIFDEKEACYGKKPFIYIIDNNKAYKTTDISVNYKEYCF